MSLRTWTHKPRSAKAGLKRVRQLIEEGWMQGSWAVSENEDYQNDAIKPTDPDVCGVCLEGAVDRAFCNNALFEAMTLPALEVPAVEALRDAVEKLSPTHTRSLINYNDGLSKTKEDVLAAVDKAIASL